MSQLVTAKCQSEVPAFFPFLKGITFSALNPAASFCEHDSHVKLGSCPVDSEIVRKDRDRKVM